jgi:hypothetical protein
MRGIRLRDKIKTYLEETDYKGVRMMMPDVVWFC